MESSCWLCDELEDLSVSSSQAVAYLLGPFGSPGAILKLLLVGAFLCYS